MLLICKDREQAANLGHCACELKDREQAANVRHCACELKDLKDKQLSLQASVKLEMAYNATA